jgi:DNA-binding FadR family transcriptional regulator
LAEGDPEGAGTALRKHFELFNEMMLEGVREE